jgi:hypothetical protein
LRYGVVGWGGPCWLVSVGYHVLRERGLVWPVPGIGQLWHGIVGLGIASATAGYLIAAWLWDVGEANYGQHRLDG